MKLISVKAENFASYESLEFDFDTGLHLVSGPTGAGKSTICDLVPWALFGKTAKNGLADDVVAWNAEGATKVTLNLEVNGKSIAVIRQRGKANDLQLLRDYASFRGKDSNDTQRMINEAVGITLEQYLVSAYYHEFSQVASFFSTTAKARRQITEELVDLTQVVKVQERAAESVKGMYKCLDKLEDKSMTAAVQRDEILRESKRTRDVAEKWQTNHDAYVAQLREKDFNFEADKAKELDALYTASRDFAISYGKRVAAAELKLLELGAEANELTTHGEGLETIIAQLKHSETCDKCGSNLASALISGYQDDLARINKLIADNNRTSTVVSRDLEPTIDPYHAQIGAAKAKSRPSGNILSVVEQEQNPHLQHLDELITELDSAVSRYEECKSLEIELKSELALVEKLKDTTALVRQALIETTMREVEAETNRLLTQHFDSIMTIEFITEAFDKLDVNITKDGNLCNFTQLSKGQRQMLKLCFAVSCMKVAANRSNTKLEQLFFDESLDGLDDANKVKSYGLLEELSQSYNSIYVVEHNSEFKTLFSSRYEVELINGNSKLAKVL